MKRLLIILLFLPLVVSCTKEDNSLTFFEKHSNEIWVLESSENFADDIGKIYLTFPIGFVLKLQAPEIQDCTYVQEGIYEEISEGVTEKLSTVITESSANKLIYSSITSGFNKNMKEYEFIFKIEITENETLTWSVDNEEIGKFIPYLGAKSISNNPLNCEIFVW